MRRFLIIALVGVVGWTPPPPYKPGPFDTEELGMSDGAQEKMLLDEVPRHAFWKVPVTTAQVSDLVDKMRTEQDDAIFSIDDHFHVAVQHGADVQNTANGRHIEINRADFYMCPSRPRLLITLRAKLDEEESGPR